MEEHRSRFPLEKMCKVLKVSRSGYYAWLSRDTSPQELHKQRLMERITHHYSASQQRYGAPRITKLLHQEGENITERTVGVYMRELGLRSNQKKTPGQ